MQHMYLRNLQTYAYIHASHIIYCGTCGGDSLALAPKVEKKERKLSQSEKKKADARRK